MVYGFDELWFGWMFDVDMFDELVVFNDWYGVYIFGEGGEFEMFVIDGLYMDCFIELEYEMEWEGIYGCFCIIDVFFGEELG